MQTNTEGCLFVAVLGVKRSHTLDTLVRDGTASAATVAPLSFVYPSFPRSRLEEMRGMRDGSLLRRFCHHLQINSVELGSTP